LRGKLVGDSVSRVVLFANPAFGARHLLLGRMLILFQRLILMAEKSPKVYRKPVWGKKAAAHIEQGRVLVNELNLLFSSIRKSYLYVSVFCASIYIPDFIRIVF